jgi:hypothetical protein
MLIDFIAYHKLQAQAAETVFENLRGKYNCRWLMGPFNVDRHGEVGVLVSHMDFHDIRKSRFGYKYLFHLSHDIADIDLYKRENLHDFDIIFVPTHKHYNACLESGYEQARIKIVGWPKYDNIKKPKKDSLISFKNPNQLKLLYAPTFASNYEWKRLFPFFVKIGCQVFVKNHIYVDALQALPPGQEEEYLKALASIEEMEATAVELGFSVITRTENICNIFNQVNILLSDSSSCLIEFLPFGVSIATGGGPFPGHFGYTLDVSLLSEDVWLCPIDKIVLIQPETFFDLIKTFSSTKKNSLALFQDNYRAGEEISKQIDEYIKENSPRYPNLLDFLIVFLKKSFVKLGM